MPNSISIRQVPGKPGQVYYPLQHTDMPSKSPSPTSVVIHMHAAALNHRDLFLRQHLYPGTTFGVPLLADGCGTVVSTGSSPSAKKWAGKRVIVNPGIGWESNPSGPEALDGYKILGGTKMLPMGTLIEELVWEAKDIEEAPQHLDDIEAAALPLTGLTAWRATIVKCGAENIGPGRNVLVTGIGGGVAIMALLFCAAAGANVYVTSGSADKIERAKKLGAKGGVSYKEKGWEKTLQAMLPKDRKFLDCIVDGAGGDVIDKAVRLIKAGGVVSQYGMTVSPKMTWTMGAVLKNIELKGSTMGSRKEFAEMVAFVKEKGLRPVISNVADGGLGDLAGIDGLFQEMKKGSQFGKLVVRISHGKDGRSKL